jgi:dihydropyrimidinase
VIFDPQRESNIIAPDTLHEAAGWTPYDGLTVTGWPRTVLLRGKVIVDSDVYLGKQDEGRFIQRQT